MKQEVKELLIKAARSGKYAKTEGQLRRGDAFCIMGLACELYDQAHGESNWVKSRRFESYTYMGELTDIPQKVMDWMGIYDVDIDILLPEGGTTTITTLNDDSRITFNDLAFLIDINDFTRNKIEVEIYTR